MWKKIKDETLEKYKEIKEFVEKATLKNWNGVSEIKNKENIENGVMPWIPLTKEQALKEAWVGKNYLANLESQYKEVEKAQVKIEENIRQTQQRLADKVLLKAMEGKGKMKDVERANLALNLQKATNAEFNPTKNVTLEVENLDFSNLSELKRQLKEEISWLE